MLREKFSHQIGKEYYLAQQIVDDLEVLLGVLPLQTCCVNELIGGLLSPVVGQLHQTIGHKHHLETAPHVGNDGRELSYTTTLYSTADQLVLETCLMNYVIDWWYLLIFLASSTFRVPPELPSLLLISCSWWKLSLLS